MPGLPQLVAAALGGLALAVGAVMLLSGVFLGGLVLLGGAALLVWSVLKPRA
jgi:hypothetical protein